MTKKGSKKPSAEALRARVVRAQDDLLTAQEARAAAILEGERDVERARRRAGARMAKATERVERKSVILSRAEADLAAELRNEGRS